MADNNEKNITWQKNATALARSFLMMFNGALLYGCAHPNTSKNADMFREQLANFGDLDMLTIISNNGTFMIEDWPLDSSFNTRKIITHFAKIGLISISFERGVSTDSVVKLIQLAGDISRIEECRAQVEEAKKTGGIAGIRLNYVLYGKIKADEVVISEDQAAAIEAGMTAGAANTAGASGLSGLSGLSEIAALSSMIGMGKSNSNISTATLSSAAAAEIEQVLTLSSLLARPKEVSEALAQANADGTLQEGRLVSAFGGLKNEIHKPSETHTAEELLESLFTLKQDLYEAIQVQKATGKVMSTASAIDREINDLTCAAIVKLAKDEYKSGKTPLNRLAHAIRRMLPDNAELMRILPSLKEMLLAEGMSLGDYLQLVRMLGLSLESETLSDALKAAADAVGATVDDLAAAIRSKPEEAARLILLASEVRGAGEDTGRLSEMLTGYIEDVSAKIAVEAPDAQDSAALKKILAQLESQMFGQLGNQGVPDPVMASVRDRLAGRFEKVFAAASEEMIAKLKEMAASGQAGASASAAQGSAIKLPPEALNAGNLLFLVNKEIGRHARYKTPFSTVLVSVEKITDADTARAPEPADAPELIPQLFAQIELLLRDVDMIGTLDSGVIPELFILLPMTADAGTEIVRDRIMQKIGQSVFMLSDRQVRVVAKVSSAAPNENTKNLKAFMTVVRENHKRC